MLDELGEVGEVVLPPAAAASQEVSASLALGLVRHCKCVIVMFVHSGLHSVADGDKALDQFQLQFSFDKTKQNIWNIQSSRETIVIKVE